MADVKLVITGDGTELRKEIDSDIRALQGFAKAVDVTNKTAVSAFRESAAAQREHMVAIGATSEQMGRLDATTRRFEASVSKAEVAQARMTTKVKTGANAMSMLAFSAAGAGGSLQGATIAAGAMAESMAAMSKNAKLAAGAAGIGALAVAVGVLIGLAVEAKRKLEEIPEGAITDFQRQRIENITELSVAAERIAVVRKQLAAATAAVGRFGDEKGLQKVVNLQAQLTALLNKQREITLADRKEAKEAADEAAKARKDALAAAADAQARLSADVMKLAAANVDAFGQRRIAAQRAFKDEEAAINKMTHLTRRERDELIALADKRRQLTIEQANAEQDAMNRRASLELNAQGSDVAAAHEARLAIIEEEKQAAIQAGMTVANAEAQALQKRRALQQDLRDSTLSDLRVLEDATIGSKNRELRAIGLVMRTIRKLEAGYKAADNAGEAISAIGRALRAAGSHDYAAAALHGASALRYAAAAAFFAKEAGGGGGGGAGGGGGGGGGGRSTDPRESSRLAAGVGTARNGEVQRLEVVFIKQDPDGREIARTRQRIDRLNQRNQPLRMAL